MNPIFLKIGSIEIHYYGLMYAISFLLGIYLAKKIAKEKNIEEEIIENYAFVAIISGLIGGRLYYVLFNLENYIGKPLEILAVWHGGMAIHGGIIGGILGTLIYAKRHKLKFFDLADIAVIPLILGQAIGRIGNFMNGEVHGVPTFTPLSVIFSFKPKFYEWYLTYLNLPLAEKLAYKPLVPWGIVFPTTSPAGYEFPNLALHPAMLYEMILNFIGFLILFFVLRKKKNIRAGYLMFTYLIIYAFNRIFVSFFRAEDLMIFGLRAPHLISFVMLVIGFIGLRQTKIKK